MALEPAFHVLTGWSIFLGQSGGSCSYWPSDATATPYFPAGPTPAALLLDVHPNPCNSHAILRFELARREGASLSIYDVRGRQLRLLFARELDAGPGRSLWDGCDGNGRTLPAGVYLCRLQTASQCVTRKLILLR